MGAPEAAANLLREFKIAPKKEEKVTKIKKGKEILVKVIASSILSLFLVNRGAIKLKKIGKKS
jgi:hypothetical protein